MNLSRTIPAMDERNARRDLALAAVTIVGLSRLLEPPARRQRDVVPMQMLHDP